MRIDPDGAQRFPCAALELLPALEAALPDSTKVAGLRLYGNPALRRLLAARSPIGRLAAFHCGDSSRPVRAILFDKSPAANWALGWHQDRTVAVARKSGVPGFGRWTVKGGVTHVEPPFEVMSAMITLRVHFDPVGLDNGPLIIAPGSHLHGRVAAHDVASIVEQCGTHRCQADAGDVWLYRTPILHASPRAAEPSRRRVLQVDYAACALPGGLQWLGI